jgi:hypothetical protein
MGSLRYEGAWDVRNAVLPDGSFAYSGTIRIAPEGQTWLLDWDISAGRYVGVGVAVGDHLLVGCAENYSGLGIALIEPQADRSVAVAWATAELGGQIGGGRFLAPWGGDWQGEHDLVQTLPGGREHGAWRLSIERVGAIYELAWRRGDATHYRGLGLATSRGLAVAWYLDIPQLALLDYAHPEGDLDQLGAVWALGGFHALGTETLARIA